MIIAKNKGSLVIFGSLFIIIGVSLLVYKYYNLNQNNKSEINAINNYFIKESNYNVHTETDKTIKEEYNYIAILEIPKIKLKRGLVDVNSKKNNVKYNIQIINSSDMPNVINGNLILAGHSGNSAVSFFKKLYKLDIGDYSYIYYNNEKYTYKVTNIYEVPKTGTINIVRNKNKTTLTMITCDQVDKTKQIVIISELVNIEKY